MLVIEGKVGKSRLLENEMKKMDSEKTLCIESVSVPYLQGLSKYQIKIEHNYDVFKTLSELKSNSDFLSEVDNIIFEINATRDYVSMLKGWDLKMNKKFVITIQNNLLQEVQVYEV